MLQITLTLVHAYDEPYCSYQPPIRLVRRGQQFKVSVHGIPVNQINNSIPATIYSGLSSKKGGLGVGQLKQDIPNCYSDLKFLLPFSHIGCCCMPWALATVWEILNTI